MRNRQIAQPKDIHQMHTNTRLKIILCNLLIIKVNQKVQSFHIIL